jgi:hypothetical protein
MTDAEDPNPFRQAARDTWLAAERPDIAADNREWLLRRGQWYEEEAARWDLRHRLVPTLRPPVESLPHRVPGESWEAVTGIPLNLVPPPSAWNPADPGLDTLKRLATALRQMPP